MMIGMCKKCNRSIAVCDCNQPERPSLPVDNMVSHDCELCGHAITYNEDLQIWCHKKKNEVFSGLEADCKYYETWAQGKVDNAYGSTACKRQFGADGYDFYWRNT